MADVVHITAYERALEQWCRAVRWRRALTPGLAKIGLTFGRWSVLKVAADLVEATGDAVNQATVARRLSLDRGSTCKFMHELAERGLVDIGPDMERHEDRIFVTESGRSILQRAADHVESVTVELVSSEAAKSQCAAE